MKKTSKRLRSLFAALAALVLAVILTVPAFAVEGGFADLYYRMNDSADVLTAEEDSELEDALEELSLRQSFDVTIATVESLESVGYDSMEAYADDLYDYCQFGYGPDMDGVLLLVSVGDRKWHLYLRLRHHRLYGCRYPVPWRTDEALYGRWRLRRCLPHLCPVVGHLHRRCPGGPPL